MQVVHLIALLTLVAAAIPAHALNRCTDAAWKVTYSDKPCPSAEQQVEVNIVKSRGFAPPSRAKQSKGERGGAAAAQVTTMGGATIIGSDQRCARAKREYEMLTPTKVGRQPTVADLFHARKTANLACGHAIDMSHGEGEIIERDQRERANRIAADWSLLDDEQRKEDAKRVHDRECLFARRGDPRAEDDKGRPCD